MVIAQFSREICMGMLNSLGNFAWRCQIPSSDTKNTEGVPKSLGDLTWYWIPMTLKM